jgi:sigma-B regulation protein RsbU (phosphoserine phosphatase)
MTIEAQVITFPSASERDVAMAGQLQRMLLPQSPFTANGWQAVHRFEPAGMVSGDYIDLIRQQARVYFMLGDVSGKGVAASMLMAQLHAMFRSLIPFGLSLEDLMTRASALLCASSLPAQYATLVCGYLEPDGEIVMTNAGHPPPLVLTGDTHTGVRATDLPIGLFCESQFSTTRLNLAASDTLFLYTDGFSEARNLSGQDYGMIRVEEAALQAARLPIADFLEGMIADQARFRGSCPNGDDVTLLAVRRM